MQLEPHAASGGGGEADKQAADARNQHAASDALVHLHINSCNWNQIEHPPHLPHLTTHSIWFSI